MKYKKFLYEDHIRNGYRVATVRKSGKISTIVHFHEFFEIEFILEGEGEHMLNGERTVARRGSIYLMTPADFHMLSLTSPSRLVTIMFDERMVSDGLMDEILRTSGNLSFQLDEPEVNALDAIATMLENEEKRHDRYSQECISHLIEYVVTTMLRHSATPGKGAQERHTHSINGALRYLYAHFRENPTVGEVARLAGYTPNYFSKLFIDVTGKSYSEYLNRLKINLAKTLLNATSQAVSEIAYSCGFNSLSNFYRAFGQQVGCSPLEYRMSEGESERARRYKADSRVAAKNEIRANMKDRRAALTVEEREEKSRAAALALLGTDEYRNAASVMLYYPIGKEVDTAYVAEAAIADGKRVIYPVTDETSGRITPIAVKSDTEFVKGGFKIPEPRGEAYDGVIDLVVVPGVAFDRRGARLGYGKGCYDGFLGNLSALKIGLCYDMQLMDTLPTEVHDVGMDMIVTESEIIKNA